jgi:hypothetical protein
MPKTPEPIEQHAPAEVTPPAAGGSYIVDPVTGELVREGGTKPAKGLTPNEAFDGLQKKGC